MKITCLAPMLSVRDVAKAAEYFRDKLGFTVQFVAESPVLATYGVVQRDGFEVHFIADEGRNPDEVRSGINVTVTDVDALYRDFEARGAFAAGFPRDHDAIREHPPEDKEYGMRDIIFIDPQGYILVFGQPL